MHIGSSSRVAPLALLGFGTFQALVPPPAGAGWARTTAIAHVASPAVRPAPAVGETELVGTLPPELRDAGVALLREKDDAAKERLLRELVAGAGAPSDGKRLAPAIRPFIVALVDAGQCPGGSRRCIGLVSATLESAPDPLLRESLERWIRSHPEPEAAVAALEALLGVTGRQLSGLLDERVDLARSRGDLAGLRTLGHAEERLGWTGRRFARLPAFFWNPPPVFSASPAASRVRVLAISDFGEGPEGQQKTAAAMLDYHRAHPFDLAVTLGDNYQDGGADSPSDARWQEYWERWYPPLGIPFYVSLGNHDWGSPDGPAAEILFSERSPQWKSPALYYTFTAGPVQFFALNTVLLSEAQLLWLRDELQKSAARWKVVYGHHHVYSAVRGDNDDLIRRLLPVLEGSKADVYLCGHEHLFQHLKRQGSVHHVVNGAAGGGARSVRKPAYEGLLFEAGGRRGFTVLEADDSSLGVRFIGEDGAPLHHFVIVK